MTSTDASTDTSALTASTTMMTSTDVPDKVKGNDITAVIILGAAVGLLACGLFVTLLLLLLRRKRRRNSKRDSDCEEARTSDEGDGKLVDNIRCAKIKTRKKSEVDSEGKGKDTNHKNKHKEKKKNDKTATKNTTKLYEDVDLATPSVHTDDQLYSEIGGEGDKTPDVSIKNQKIKDTQVSTTKKPAVGIKSSSLGRLKGDELANDKLTKDVPTLYSAVDKSKKKQHVTQTMSGERAPSGKLYANIDTSLPEPASAEMNIPKAEQNASEAESSEGTKTTPKVTDKRTTEGDRAAESKALTFSRSASSPNGKSDISGVRRGADRPKETRQHELYYNIMATDSSDGGPPRRDGEDRSNTKARDKNNSDFSNKQGDLKDGFSKNKAKHESKEKKENVAVNERRKDEIEADCDKGTESGVATRVKHEHEAGVENLSEKAKSRPAIAELYSQVHKPKGKNTSKVAEDKQGASVEVDSYAVVGGESSATNEAIPTASMRTLDESKTAAVGKHEKNLTVLSNIKQSVASKASKIMKKLKKRAPHGDDKVDTDLYETVKDEDIEVNVDDGMLYSRIHDSVTGNSKPAAAKASDKESDLYSEVREAPVNLVDVDRSTFNPEDRQSCTVITDNPGYLRK